jgi:heat shock protein HslJ
MKVADADGAGQLVGGTAEFRIDGNHLRASDTCNTLDGTLQLDYPILDLDALSTTEIGCPAGSVAPIIDRVLTGKVRVDFRDATLTLTKDGAGTLTYRWQPDDEQATDPRRIVATDWQLRSIAGDRASGITLRIADGRLELAAGCGATDVPVDLAPGTVYAPHLAKHPNTECPPEWRNVAAMLSTVPALWRIAGHQLIVNQAGAQGYALVFDAAKDVSAAVTELPGTWKLTGIEKRDGNSDSGSGSSSSTVSLTLTSHGYRFAGACGTLAGTAQLGDQQITFDDAMDRNDCWDNELLRSFAGPVRWILENGQLKLTKGDVTLTFER